MKRPYSRNKIEDEFTDRAGSRQYKWQLRKAAAGQCRICGVEAPRQLCEVHRIQSAVLGLRWRERHQRGPKKPYRGKWLTKAGLRPAKEER